MLNREQRDSCPVGTVIRWGDTEAVTVQHRGDCFYKIVTRSGDVTTTYAGEGSIIRACMDRDDVAKAWAKAAFEAHDAATEAERDSASVSLHMARVLRCVELAKLVYGDGEYLVLPSTRSAHLVQKIDGAERLLLSACDYEDRYHVRALERKLVQVAMARGLVAQEMVADDA